MTFDPDTISIAINSIESELKRLESVRKKLKRSIKYNDREFYYVTEDLIQKVGSHKFLEYVNSTILFLENEKEMISQHIFN